MATPKNHGKESKGVQESSPYTCHTAGASAKTQTLQTYKHIDKIILGKGGLQPLWELESKTQLSRIWNAFSHKNNAIKHWILELEVL